MNIRRARALQHFELHRFRSESWMVLEHLPLTKLCDTFAQPDKIGRCREQVQRLPHTFVFAFGN
ncbi:hypothetical protein RCCGE510_03732 [Rhizobium sp. CCGE 510]|nr:hypothetical protein RCCGE510_03732 [Rhizobium sp. CCGE 510]